MTCFKCSISHNIVASQVQLCQPTKTHLLETFKRLCNAGNVINKQRLIRQ